MIAHDQPGLFDQPREVQTERAIAARDVGLARVAASTARIAPSWREQALEAVRLHAQANRIFLLEDVHGAAPMPEGLDPRVWGPIAMEAKRRRWIHPHGYAPANSSNRSPKVLWLSLLYFEAAR